MSVPPRVSVFSAIVLTISMLNFALMPYVLRTATHPRILFGMGPVASSAAVHRLVVEAPVSMLTTWYNQSSDLKWITRWREDLVPQLYAEGFTLHLIVFTDEPETRIDTAYGPACGRPYPLSDRFLDDMAELATTFAHPSNELPLYVTLFTEMQTYACIDNAWNPDAPTQAYYRALKDRYREARAIFHELAPNAMVSLGWGGWQTRWDDPAIGGGRSMFSYFEDVMRESDFQSFQAMESGSNITDVQAMVRRLGRYGPVMVAHYKPNNQSQSTFEHDVRALLTRSSLARLQADGLFAWSFMDSQNLDASDKIFEFTRDAIKRYSWPPAAGRSR